MKNLLTTLLFCSLSYVNAQEVSDYKYINIPEKFSGFNEGQYQLNNRLRFILTQKKFAEFSLSIRCPETNSCPVL